jgi:hypothetical protein
VTQAEFTALTGITLDSSETTRFATIEEKATKELERQLGYPLDPSDWENLYNETGKASDCPCPDVDIEELEPPDAVVGTYRLYDFYPDDRFLHIDPATEINRVKLVNNSVTYKTFNDEDNENEYLVKWENGDPQFARYLDLEGCVWRPCWKRMKYVQLAVDAEWGFEEIPVELQSILADLIANGYERPNLDIQSESRGSHSYTRGEGKTLSEKYPALAEFAGPNGLAVQKRLI